MGPGQVDSRSFIRELIDALRRDGDNMSVSPIQTKQLKTPKHILMLTSAVSISYVHLNVLSKSAHIYHLIKNQ